MSRIIINNESKLHDANAVCRVLRTIEMGLISDGRHGEQYCFATNYDDATVIASKTEAGTHTFTVFDKENKTTR